MELNEEDLEFDLSNMLESTNPKLIIRNYFENIKQEIETYSDNYLNDKLLQKSHEDRLEIKFKRDKMLAQLDILEKQCYSSKSERQFVKLSTSLNFLLDKLNSISNEFFNKIDLNIINADRSVADQMSTSESQIKSELCDLKKDLFLNRTVFFVRNTTNFKSNQFGNLVILDFYLDDFEIIVLK